MAANDKCKALEILQNEVQSEDGSAGDSMNRLFVNPEFVQELDQSDGSKQFDDNERSTYIWIKMHDSHQKLESF